MGNGRQEVGKTTEGSKRGVGKQYSQGGGKLEKHKNYSTFFNILP